MAIKTCIKVAVFSPIRGQFYYLPNDKEGIERYQKGQRVVVPFRRSERVGIVLEISDNFRWQGLKLKKIDHILDEKSMLPSNMIKLAEWASNYYHYPLGSAVSNLFPPALRKKVPYRKKQTVRWQISGAGKIALKENKKLGKRQKKFLDILIKLGLSTLKEIKLDFPNTQINQVARGLENKGWIEKNIKLSGIKEPTIDEAQMVRLNEEQSTAVSYIHDQREDKRPVVLNGVTGSGKTEVYIEIIRSYLKRSQQAILLAPEITLAEHLYERLQKVFPESVGIAHSSYSDGQRLLTWDLCRTGELRILVGTRSAVWTPMKNLGLIIVDEEHDSSYRQQDGFMYSGRDTAIVRAKLENINILLGSATPSLETFRNIEIKKFKQVFLTKGAVAPRPPSWEVVDLKKYNCESGLTDHLLSKISSTLAANEQILLFLNRRGYSPVVICSNCGYKPICKNCDWTMVYHKSSDLIICHHCGYSQKMSELDCCYRKKFKPIGLGTERIYEAVKKNFPDSVVERVDSDIAYSTTDIKHLFQRVSERKVDILVGTQMVAKGLDFSGITLIGILNPDSALYSGEFKAEERLAQLLIQVSGRAARAIKRGAVVLQSAYPDHPIIEKLIADGYSGYVHLALQERKNHNTPPFSMFALIKATSKIEIRIKRFLDSVRKKLNSFVQHENIAISQIIPMTLYKKAGFFRCGIVVRCKSKSGIQNLMSRNINEIEQLARQNKVRWSVELDPEGML